MKYTFELLCINPYDIANEKVLAQGLSFSSNLWLGGDPVIKEEKKTWTLSIDNNKTKISILPVDTSNVLTDYFDAAFTIHLASSEFDYIESMRERLLLHLKRNLAFKHIRILKDDVSSQIAKDLYPYVNEIENMLRKYLTKFFIQRVGINWWESTATKGMSDKVKIRKKDRKDKFTDFIDVDVSVADFDDLGQLIYKQSSGFNNPEKAIERLHEISSMEELATLKSELQGNYIKYFKDFFKEKQFEQKWEYFFNIRNKVAHQGTFFREELEQGKEVYDSLKLIIEEAEDNINKLVFSVADKEAIRNTMEASLFESSTSESVTSSTEVDDSPKIKVVGKIELPTVNTRAYNSNYSAINEAELLDNLEEAQNIGQDYVGLKQFVTNYLAQKGYSIGLSYSLINILSDKGKIEIYDEEATSGYPVKAIRILDFQADNLDSTAN